jgi:hypothetical protein
MKLQQVSASIFILSLFSSLAAGLTTVKADSQFPFPIGMLHIESPINRTYTTGFLQLNVSFSGLCFDSIKHSLTYSLDGNYMGTLPIEPHYPDWLSVQAGFTASVVLPELAKGQHIITVNAEYSIYNYTTNDGVFHSKLTKFENATVVVNISDTIPLNELTAPVISDLSVENKAYPSAALPLNFNVDKAVMWTGYCLDGYNLTITDWWNTPATARRFNVTLKGLTEGSHSLAVYAEDTFGNTGTSKIVNFAIDTTPPVISILSIQNRTYDSATVPLTFAINEPTIQIEYNLDGQNNITIIENSTLTRLSNGMHNITIYAWDEAGNIGFSQTTSFSVYVQELFSMTLAVALASSVAACAGLLMYFKKRKH